jgi:hypothetical protein
MMFLEIVVERFAARALKQRMKMHIGSISFRKTWAVCFAQGAHASFAALVTHFTTFIPAPMIKAHPRTSSSHGFSPLFSA